MTTWQLLTSFWDWEPWVLLMCAAVIVSYMTMIRFHFFKAVLFFMAGVLVLLLALVSPVGMLGHTYLFSAHMLQHILLLLIVPLLLLLGIHPWLAKKMLDWSPLGKVERVFGQPLVAWLLGVGAMWVWHIPVLYNAVLGNEILHIVQQLSLLVIGTIFWWPVFVPLEELRLAPLSSILYLFSACVGCTILGIILTFTTVGLYPAYLHPIDTLGILPLLREGWGLSPAADQQIGGLLMWVPCCLIYLCATMLTLARWYREPEVDVMTSSPISGSSRITATPQQQSKSNVA